MTKVTVTIDSKSNVRLFLKMLRELRYVKDIEAAELNEDALSKEDIKLLEKRWNDYLKNPKAVQSWGEVKSELTKKYLI